MVKMSHMSLMNHTECTCCCYICCRTEDSAAFQVNMVDWTFYSRYFYTILVNWMGGKAAVLESTRRTSCGVTAMELLQREIREECLQASESHDS